MSRVENFYLSKNKKNNFRCKHCEKVYFHQQSLHNHVKKNHQEPEKLFMCPQCPKHFDSEKKLKTHESVHLPDEKKMIHPCPYCDKKFTKNVNVSVSSFVLLHFPFNWLLELNFNQFNGDIKIFNWSSSSSLNIQAHIKSIHQMERPFLCSDCGKDFSTKGN